MAHVPRNAPAKQSFSRARIIRGSSRLSDVARQPSAPEHQPIAEDGSMFNTIGKQRENAIRWMQPTWRRLLVATPLAAVVGFHTADVVASVKLSPASVTAGGSSTGTVVVSGLCKSCVAMVSLTSSTPSVATVPATATTSNGISGSSATFAVHAVSGAAGCSVITAKSGTSSQSVLLTVQPSGGSGLTLSLKFPSTVGGGVDSGFVALPPGNKTLPSDPVAQLSTSDPNIATVPATVTLKANFIEGGIIIYKAAFAISTRDSGRNTCAGITATSGSSKAQTLLQLFTASG
jgi:hypothetical protein